MGMITFSNKWEEICNNSSIALMQLIITTNSSMLVELAQQIEEKENALGGLISPSGIETFKKELFIQKLGKRHHRIKDQKIPVRSDQCSK